jgi:predicted RNA-binding protein with PIN domain
MPELVEIEPRYLRSAIEFAVAIAAEAQKRKMSIPFPSELKTQLSKSRIPSKSLGRLRRAIEADDVFRQRVALGATPELVDEVGTLWLKQPTNWETDAAKLIAGIESAEQEAGLEAALRTSEKRRLAAEQLAVRTRADLVGLAEGFDSRESEIDVLRADLTKADDLLSEMKAEIIDVRNESRHARDRESAAVTKLQVAIAELEQVRRSSEQDEQSIPESVPSNEAEIAAAAKTARDLADQLASLLPDTAKGSRVEPSRPTRLERRQLLPLPGGVISSSAEAALFFVRSDAEILVDGYNVAKLGWPRLDLEAQRNTLLDAVENLVRRYGADITVIFDGASIVGAHTGRRRLMRVVFSPEGVTADDVIRDEVRRIHATHSVVVVTNDAEIVRDVRADGANALPSNALLAVI